MIRIFVLKYLLPAFLLIAGTAFLQTAEAQNKKEDVNSGLNLEWISKDTPDLHEFSILGGYSFSSTNGFWGKMPKATLSIFALRYNRKLFYVQKNNLLEYTVELNISANYYNPGIQDISPGSFTGFGITPLGFQYNWRKNKPIQPFLKSSTGFLYLDNPFPDSRGIKFNFVLEVGTGVEFMLTEYSSFTVGYKYHHMSNGEIGQVNPGVDSNIFYGALTFF